jgi:hypothetical protein
MDKDATNPVPALPEGVCAKQHHLSTTPKSPAPNIGMAD